MVCVAACGDNAKVPAVPLVSGPATLTLTDDSTLVFARDGKTLLTMRGDAFAIGTVDDLDSGASFDPFFLYNGMGEQPEGMKWRELPADAELTVLRSAKNELAIGLDLDGAKATIVFVPAGQGGFAAHVSGVGTAGQAAFVRVRADADATEGFYGLGEWADGVMHRGKLRPMQMEADLTTESSDNENHVPVPLLIGTRGWGVFAASNRPGVFDVATQSDTRVELAYGTGTATADGLDWFLFSADQPVDILKSYFAVTGNPGLPAEWTYGPLLWRDEHRDQAQVIDDIDQIRTRHLATSGIWFDRPYSTGVETFDFSATKFPDPTTMLQALHDAGLRYAIWQAPYVADAANDDPAPDNLAIATQMGFFPPTTGVLLNPWGKPIDFTNRDAYAWWQENLTKYTTPLEDGGFGVEGYKLDYAEDVVVGVLGQRVPWEFADGSDERTMAHDYQLLYHRIHRETLPAEGGFLLTRTGRWGDQTQGVIIWPGDLDATFDHYGDPLDGAGAVGGLPTALSFGIGLSASGFPFYGSDTGGYRHSPPNREVWLRWVEANAISSCMQVGDSSSQMPWEFTPENGRDNLALTAYQFYAGLHIQLFPYAWTYALSMADTGRPIMRPIGLMYPDLGHPSDQFLFGDDILSAPVITAGATSREVMFPPGEWLNWFDGAVVDGGAAGATKTIDAPVETLPLFVRRGAIVPMLRPTVETLAPATTTVDSAANDPGVLTIRIAPGPASSFTVFDGAAITQDNGTAITYAPGSRYTAGAVFEVIAFSTGAPTTVTSNGVALVKRNSRAAFDNAAEGFFFDVATGGTLFIKVAGAATISVD